jgi:hypothetical protein
MKLLILSDIFGNWPALEAVLQQGGYTQLVVYLAQQKEQFRLRGEEFAMQHLGAEEELNEVLQRIVATMSPQERLQGLSEEEVLQGLTPEQQDRLRRLLELRRPANGNASAPKTT